MSKIQIDTAKLDKAIAVTFDRTVERQSEAFDQAMSDDLYDWPRQTKRRNGEIAGSPRSIVDTGELKESKAIARSSSSQAAEFGWNTDYAAAVHNGCTLKNGTEIPPRPWTEKGIEIAQPIDFFARGLRRLL